MVNRNHRLKKWLALALTGTEGEDMEVDDSELVCDGDNKGEEEEEDPDKDDDDEEGLLDDDEDEEQVQANEASNKKFPLAHRLQSSRRCGLQEQLIPQEHALFC